MLKFLFTYLLLISTGFVFAQSPNFVWVKIFKPFDPTGRQDTRSMTIDDNGNVYSTGYFTMTVDFDPGPAVYNLNSTNTDLFISKIDASGNFLWAKQVAGSTIDINAAAITLDPAGNIFITGKFNSLTDFDPGPAVYNLNTLMGFKNTFILKLNNNGNFIWARSILNTNGFDNDPMSLKADNAGNIYIDGHLEGSADFDPGPGSFVITDTNNGSLFVLKLDVAGNFVWAKQVISASPYCIAYDPNGAICMTGYFFTTTDFDPGPNIVNLTPSGPSDIYILKLDLDGNLIWAKSIGGPANDGGNSITTDDLGNIYTSGTFYGTADMDPGPGTYDLPAPNPGFSAAFILKLNAQGNFTWAKAIGGGSQTTGRAIAVDNQKNVYVTGDFWLTADFDPGPDVFNLTAGSSYNGYVLKLNSSGNFNWAKYFDGGLNSGFCIAVDQSRNVYTCGRYFQIVDFDTGPAFFYLTAAGSPIGFIHKLGQPCIANTSSTLDINACDNYTLNDEIYTSSGTYMQVIANSTGCDSTITLNLVIGKRSTSIDTTICEGTTYFAGGADQTLAGTYIDTLQTTQGCDSVITTRLSIKPKPTPDLGKDRRLCKDVRLKVSPGSFSSYSWQDLSTGSTFTITGSGTYWVTVTGANNCSATDSLTIPGIDSVPKNFLPADYEICIGLGNAKDIYVPGYQDYLWNTGSSSNSILITDTGMYYLTVIDKNDCKGQDTIIITGKTDCIPFIIPNAFTPNGDGKNEIFRPKMNIQTTSYSFVIFNRYGQKIFETRTYPDGWDGKYKGKDQPAGTYVYFIRYETGNGFPNEEKGTFLLAR